MARKVIKSVSLGSNARDDLNAMFTELYSNLGVVGVTASAAELNYLDIASVGTGANLKAVVPDAGGDYTWPTNGIFKYFQIKDADDTLLSATVEYINQQCDYVAQQIAPAAGFLGTGTIHKAIARKTGNGFKTEFMIDLTGAASIATDGHIIGNSGVSHIGRLTTALNGGTILMGRMTCLEVPAGGTPDVDLYSATEGTGAYNSGVGSLTEQKVVDAAGNWTIALTKAFTLIPVTNDYLYFTAGAASGAGTYTAGKFLIELWGY